MGERRLKNIICEEGNSVGTSAFLEFVSAAEI